MGVLFFLIISIAGIYWVFAIFRSLNADGISTSRRREVSLDYLRSVGSMQPKVVPVDEAKIPAQLPPLKPDPPVVPIFIPPTPPPTIDRAAVLPNFGTPPSSIEESLLFRCLVLGMFGVSTIGIDLAAGTHYSLVGIPFSTIGAIWSWYRRYHAKQWLNILVSVLSVGIVFCVLVPMLVHQVQIAIDPVPPAAKSSTLFALILGLISVSLQMGLSFHLYHRRLLGYGLVTSGISMGVAASLSQNISFLLLLAGFTAFAIPTLMLDYRSRLALKPIGIDVAPSAGQLSYRHLPWRYLQQLAAISLVLGLMLAVFLPNFHVPDLSWQPPQIDRPQPHLPAIDRDRIDNPNSASSPPPANASEVASKLLGQPGNNNYPETILQEYLQLTPELAAQLRNFTQQILATSPQPLDSDYDRATYLAAYLKQHYQSDPDRLQPTDLPPIEQIYRSMLTSLSKRNRSKLSTQTQLEYAQIIKTTEHPQIAQAVAEISQLYTAWRYGQQRINVKQLSQKLLYLQHLQQLAAKRKRQQMLARWKSVKLIEN